MRTIDRLLWLGKIKKKRVGRAKRQRVCRELGDYSRQQGAAPPSSHEPSQHTENCGKGEKVAMKRPKRGERDGCRRAVSSKKFSSAYCLKRGRLELG